MEALFSTSLFQYQAQVFLHRLCQTVGGSVTYIQKIKYYSLLINDRDVKKEWLNFIYLFILYINKCVNLLILLVVSWDLYLVTVFIISFWWFYCSYRLRELKYWIDSGMKAEDTWSICRLSNIWEVVLDSWGFWSRPKDMSYWSTRLNAANFRLLRGCLVTKSNIVLVILFIFFFEKMCWWKNV